MLETELPILAFDPGLSGAMAVLWPDGRLIVHDIPTMNLTRNGKAKSEPDLVQLGILVGQHGPYERAIIEQVGAMPGQGVSSMFAFGKVYGGIQGVVAAYKVPLEFVPPSTWKKVMGLASGAGKDASRARATALLPQHAENWPLVKHDGRAEAALLALYAKRLTPAKAITHTTLLLGHGQT